MTGPICFLDIETTGLHPGREAWEVGLLRRDPDGSERASTFFVQVDLSAADLGALRVGGFWDRHPTGRRIAHGTAGGGQPKARRAAAFEVARHTHGATIVGATPNFDTETLTALLAAEGLTGSWSHRLRCVTTLTAGHLGRDTGGLAASARALGIEPVNEHTAAGDVATAAAIWDRIMQPPPGGTVSAITAGRAAA